MAASPAQTARKANVQPNTFPAIIRAIIAYLGEVMGHIDVPQKDLLSEKGNVVFEGGIRRGLRLPGEGEVIDDKFVRGPAFNAAAALAQVAFNVDGVLLKAGEVHTSSPKRRADGTTYGGGNPTVCHTGTITVTDGVKYRVMVFLTDLGAEKGFNLKVQSFMQPVNVGGPVVTGTVVGLLVG